MIKFDKYIRFNFFNMVFFVCLSFTFYYFFNLRKRNEKQKLLCDICLRFTLKFGRTFILKKKVFFFLVGAIGLEPRGTSFIEEKVKKEENHETKVEVIEGL